MLPVGTCNTDTLSQLVLSSHYQTISRQQSEIYRSPGRFKTTVITKPFRVTLPRPGPHMVSVTYDTIRRLLEGFSHKTNNKTKDKRCKNRLAPKLPAEVNTCVVSIIRNLLPKSVTVLSLVRPASSAVSYHSPLIQGEVFFYFLVTCLIVLLYET